MGDREGYVKLWRKLLDSEEWQSMNGGQRCVMVSSLLLAGWKDETIQDSYGEIFVPRGAFLSSVRKLSECSGVSEKTVRSALSRMTSCGFLTQHRAHQGAHAGTVYTICNYELYQDSDVEGGTVPGTVVRTQGHTGADLRARSCAPTSARSIYEEVKKCKKQLPVLVPCLQCNEQWRLIPGRNGRESFYGHGKLGSSTGCRATCPASEYEQRKAAANRPWGDDDF